MTALDKALFKAYRNYQTRYPSAKAFREAYGNMPEHVFRKLLKRGREIENRELKGNK